jgi:hypothetical protein
LRVRIFGGRSTIDHAIDMKNALVHALVPVVAESCEGVIGYIRHEVIGRRKEGQGRDYERQPRLFRTDRTPLDSVAGELS